MHAVAWLLPGWRATKRHAHCSTAVRPQPSAGSRCVATAKSESARGATSVTVWPRTSARAQVSSAPALEHWPRIACQAELVRDLIYVAGEGFTVHTGEPAAGHARTARWRHGPSNLSDRDARWAQCWNHYPALRTLHPRRREAPAPAELPAIISVGQASAAALASIVAAIQVTKALNFKLRGPPAGQHQPSSMNEGTSLRL